MKIFNFVTGIIIKALGAQRDLMNGISELSLSEQENGLLLQYKELIREQDRRLQELTAAVNNLTQEKISIQVILEMILNLQIFFLLFIFRHN